MVARSCVGAFLVPLCIHCSSNRPNATLLQVVSAHIIFHYVTHLSLSPTMTLQSDALEISDNPMKSQALST